MKLLDLLQQDGRGTSCSLSVPSLLRHLNKGSVASPPLSSFFPQCSPPRRLCVDRDSLLAAPQA